MNLKKTNKLPRSRADEVKQSLKFAPNPLCFIPLVIGSGFISFKFLLMNKIYESPTMVIHDDREPLTTEQAIDLLWNGKTIRINDIPDFSEENEGREFLIDITDILSRDILENQSKEKSKKQIEEYLGDYEIYR